MYSGHLSLASVAAFAFLAAITSASPIPSLTERPASVPEATWTQYRDCVAAVTAGSTENCGLILSDTSAANSPLYEFKA